MRIRHLIRSLLNARTPGGHGALKQREADALREFESAQREAAGGRIGAAEQSLRRAIELDRDSAELHYNLGLLLHGVGDIEHAEASYLKALELNPDYQPVHSSYLCLCDFSPDTSRAEALRRHRDWARRYADIHLDGLIAHPNPRDPSRRLRLGYISSDFRDHVVSRFVGPVLEHHDSSRFDVYCYSTSELADSTTARLMKSVRNWRKVDELGDSELADRIRADGIDILVDLSGHSAGNRLLALARKPAPIQLTWMGYLGTSGMAALDYKCTDVVADPMGVEQFYQEELLRLDSSQWCFDMRYLTGGDPYERFTARPRSAGRQIRLACMARFMKISDECVKTWIGAMRRNRSFHLDIIDSPNHPRRDRIHREFDKAGLSERVTFISTLRPVDYWAKFADLDIVLDPFPYTGATTTIDALAMGVPVVSLAGVCGASRSGASVLSEVGMREYVTSSPEQYIEAIGTLASLIARGKLARNDVRTAFRKCKSSDAALFTKRWESQLIGAWRRWCASPTSGLDLVPGGV